MTLFITQPRMAEKHALQSTLPLSTGRQLRQPAGLQRVRPRRDDHGLLGRQEGGQDERGQRQVRTPSFSCLFTLISCLFTY